MQRTEFLKRKWFLFISYINVIYQINTDFTVHSHLPSPIQIQI